MYEPWIILIPGSTSSSASRVRGSHLCEALAASKKVLTRHGPGVLSLLRRTVGIWGRRACLFCEAVRSNLCFEMAFR